MSNRRRKDKEDSYLNCIFKTTDGLLMKVVEYKNTAEVKVLFENGLEVWSSMQKIRNGSVYNYTYPSLYGVGYLGISRSNLKQGVFYKKCYSVWFSMLRRCYDIAHDYSPTYENVTVCEEWHNFQNFTKWFEENYNFETMNKWHLDKDIICPECKVYSPETCCFVPQEINSMFAGYKKYRNWLPQGVFYHSRDRYFTSSFKNKYIGSSYSSEELFNKFKVEKESYIYELTNKYKNVLNENVFNILINYKITHKGVFPTIEFCEDMLSKENKDIKVEYSLDDIIEAVQYGFDYRVDSMNNGKHVPLGNTLQWLMMRKELKKVPEEFAEKLKNRELKIKLEKCKNN